MSLPSRLLGANPSIQVSTLLSGSLTTPSAKGAFLSGAYESIATASANGTSSFSFTAIPQTYTHLQLRISAQSTRSDNLDGFTATLNSSTGNVYFGRQWYGEQYNGGSQTIAGITGNGSLGSTAPLGGVYITGANNSTIPTTFTWDFLNYANTSRMKTFCMYIGGMTSANYQSAVSGMSIQTFTSLSGITSMQFSMAYGGNFTNTTFALYGVK